jgi:hypothetical protein
MAAFVDYYDAELYAVTNGHEIDPQDNYCGPCRGYHVGASHEDDVPVECGAVDLQGFQVVLECKRPPHADDEHRDFVNSWRGESVL